MSLKHVLHQLLVAGDFEAIVEMGMERRRVLPTLVALTFAPDLEVAWRAVEALGATASRVTEVDPAAVREQLRRLHWLISEESGGICWRAPECMAEIVHRQPVPFSDYVPITFHLLVTLEEEDLGHFRAGALWAAGRLARLAGEMKQEVLPAVVAALEDTDPQVRGMAVWCLSQMGETDVLAGRRTLSDEGAVALYEDRRVSRTTVGELVKRMIGDQGQHGRL